VSRDGVALATIAMEDSIPNERAEEILRAMAETLRRPLGAWNTAKESTVDVVMVACPGGVRHDQHAHLQDEMRLASDLTVIPVSSGLRDVLYAACDPPGIGKSKFRIDLRKRPLYAFVRSNPPRDSTHAWDPDHRLQTCLALSRLVRPTSASFRYSARIVGDIGADRFEVTPGIVRQFGAEAWTSQPDQDWLSVDDFVELRDLLAAHESQPLKRGSRAQNAFWMFEYAARTYYVDYRVPLVSTALETLLGTGKDQVTKQFIKRIPQLAAKVGLPTIAKGEAEGMWELRSELVHGARHGGLGTQSFQLYERLETVLRMAIKRALLDPEFRAQFATMESVSGAFPMSPKAPTLVTCPECSCQFDA
jgi:hypothetical protein